MLEIRRNLDVVMSCRICVRPFYVTVFLADRGRSILVDVSVRRFHCSFCLTIQCQVTHGLRLSSRFGLNFPINIY